jgi:hypothetical protein
MAKPAVTPTILEVSPYSRERNPPLVLRVGVTGHRPKDLPPPGQDADLRQAIRTVLAEIKRETDKLFRELRSFYSGDDVVYRLISPLAEGADRLVAEEAIALDYKLQCPFPFPEDEYKRDFKSPHSLAEFKRLRESAKAVFELDGSRAAEEEAYEAVGRMVLRQCDVLIAVWNGKPAVGKGGTGQIVYEALTLNLPTIRIKPWSPRHPYLMRSRHKNPQGRREPATLATRLSNILIPPSDDRQEGENDNRNKQNEKTEREKIQRFFCEKNRRGSPLFKSCLRRLSKGYKKPSLPRMALEIPKENSIAEIWERFAGVNKPLGENLAEVYGWRFCLADLLAECYVAFYRSSFVTTYLFGALAVFSAFFAIHRKSPQWFYVELYLIVSILALLWIAKRDRWHERWIDYRLLAEALRQMEILAPLGRVTPAFEVPPHLDQEDPAHTWFNWYFRATVRHAGLAQARIDDKFLQVYKDGLIFSVVDQICYHSGNSSKLAKAHHRLHLAATYFFWGTLVACVLHILPMKYLELWMGTWWHETSSLCAIVLPALGAAVEGIVHQGEFERSSRRSKAMARRLEEFLGQLERLPQRVSSQDLGLIAENFCRAQLQEQADWRSVFIAKELTTP